MMISKVFNKKFSLVSIIIVVWNGLEDIKDCLNSLKKITYKYFEIIIVDNGSHDGSLEYFEKARKSFKNFSIIKNRKNLGYAEGNNIGFKEAKGDLILLLNNDTIVEPDFLDVLVKEIQSNKKIAGVQPKILSFPEKNIIDSVGSYFIFSGFLYHYGHNKKDNEKFNKKSKIFSMKGACMLFRKEAIDKVGLFDNSYFAYFEETDLCLRLWIAGYKIYYIPASKIYHKGGKTAVKLNNAFIQYNSYKNRIYTYLKNFQAKTLLRIMPIHIILCELSSLLYLFTFKFSIFLAIQRGIIWNIVNFNKIINDRKKIKELRCVDDNKFLPGLSRKVRLDYYYHLFVTSLVGYID